MKLRFGIIASLLLFLLGGNIAFAGFGITPPYVHNDSLTRDSEYDQQIILTRSDPVEDLKAIVTVSVPGANDWFTVDKGNEFVLPQGETQVPMTVKVRVPKKAKFGEYRGNIRVVISSASQPTPGTVGISLGAQIDVTLTVIDKQIFNFFVRGQHLDPIEEGHFFGWRNLGFYFPGKIKFVMQVENTGNVPFAPTKVVLDIRDSFERQVLEHTENLNKIDKVKPFEIKDVTAELPTRLPPGSYHAYFKIYKFDQVAKEGELNLSIVPYGTFPGYHGFYFFGLRRAEQAIVVGTLLAFLAALVGAGLYGRRVLRRRRMRPPRYVG